MSFAELPSIPVTTESDAIALSTINEVLVASEIGNNSCCDVWIRVPSTWLGRVTVRLYALLGDARLLLRQVALDRVPITTASDGTISGIAISVRGHPASAFEVTCQATEGPGAIEGGYVYLQVWYANVPPYVSGGDILPETKVSPPLVAAVLVGRDETTGELVQISTDSTGRFLMSNPLFTDADQALLDGATDAATPSTLVLRDASGDSHFRHLYVRAVDYETSGGGLLLGTESSTTAITIGQSGAPTTIWNATLDGTTTIIDSTSLQVTDRVITVNKTTGPNAPVPSQIAGISVMRGDVSGANRNFVGLFWDESAGVFRLAYNTAGDDSTLGAGVPVVATEFRGPSSAAAVLRANASTDAVQLSASTTTLLSVSDASGTTKLDPGDRGAAVGTTTAAASGAGKAMTVQAQQGAAGSAGGTLNLQAGKGGTPGTNLSGDIIFENGQSASTGGAGATGTGLNRWQSNGSDYLTLQLTNNGASFTTPDGALLTMKSGGAGTTLSANTGNLNLYGNALGTFYAANLTLGGDTITWEDSAVGHRWVWNNAAAWASTYAATVTSVTQGWTQAATGTGGTWSIKAQQGASGSPGGIFKIGGGSGGTSGSNKAGDTQVDLGIAVSSVSARFSLLESGSEFLGLYKSAGNLNLDSSSNFYMNISGQLVIQPSGTQIGNDLVLFNTAGWTCHLYTGNAFSTIKQDDVTTNSATGAPLTLQAQNATGTSATGGKLSLNAGSGTLKGGNLEVFAGNPTGSTGAGGDLLLGAGSFTIGGEAGNIAMHKLGAAPSFGGGGKITFLNNAHTEPTSNPSGGLFFWGRNGQLATRDQQGAVEELSTRWTKTSGATGVIVLVRSDNLSWATVTNQTVLQIPNADLPASSNWLCHALVTYLISDTTTSQTFAKEYKEITIRKLSGTITIQSANTVGVFLDGTSAAVSAAGCTAAIDGSSNVNFTVNSLKGNALNAYVRAELTFFVP